MHGWSGNVIQEDKTLAVILTLSSTKDLAITGNEVWMKQKTP